MPRRSSRSTSRARPSWSFTVPRTPKLRWSTRGDWWRRCSRPDVEVIYGQFPGAGHLYTAPWAFSGPWVLAFLGMHFTGALSRLGVAGMPTRSETRLRGALLMRRLIIVVVLALMLPFTLGALPAVHGQEATPWWTIDSHPECDQRALYRRGRYRRPLALVELPRGGQSDGHPGVGLAHHDRGRLVWGESRPRQGHPRLCLRPGQCLVTVILPPGRARCSRWPTTSTPC